jgi:hypothetical protein
VEKRKGNKKTEIQKRRKMVNKKKKNYIKEEEPKMKVLIHELLASTHLSNANLLVILQSFKSLFKNSSQVKFGLSLPLFLLSV